MLSLKFKEFFPVKRFDELNLFNTIETTSNGENNYLPPLACTILSQEEDKRNLGCLFHPISFTV